MSQINVDTIKSRTGGAPTLSQGVVVSAAATFSGNVSIAGTLTYEDVTNIDSIGIVTARTGVKVTAGGVDVTAGGLNITAGVSTLTTLVPSDTRLRGVAEKLIVGSGNTITISYGSTANIGFATNPTGDITIAVTDIPTTSDFDNHTVSFSVFVNQTGTARTCTAVTLNGVSRTIKWSGGSLSAAIAGVTTSSGYDIFSFTGINTVGSASTTANYQVLGMVNGGFA